MFKDDPERLRAAALYVEAPPAVQVRNKECA